MHPAPLPFAPRKRLQLEAKQSGCGYACNNIFHVNYLLACLACQLKRKRLFLGAATERRERRERGRGERRWQLNSEAVASVHRNGDFAAGAFGRFPAVISFSLAPIATLRRA